MTASLRTHVVESMQRLIIGLARPYIVRELPGWGHIYRWAVGDYQRGWFWDEAPWCTMRGKMHGYEMRLDLSQWPDRSTFFLGRWYDLNNQLLMLDVIEPGDTVIDVGANRGMFALVASRLVGRSGKVVCFEPNPQCSAQLDRDIAANGIANIVVNRVGLADRDDEMTLSVPNINSGEGTFGPSVYGENESYEISAPVKVGDRLLAHERPALIKIDVEGFECGVIAGLAQTIHRHRPVLLTEVAPAHLQRCGASVQQLNGQLSNLGYHGFALTLKRRGLGHTWALDAMQADGDAIDAVWFHRDFIERYSVQLQRHGLPTVH